MDQLSKVSVYPEHLIAFDPSQGRQSADLVVTNNSDGIIIIKMKSTRPGLYKMKPVYASVAPSEKKLFKMEFKGFGAGQKIPTHDRFSVVLALVTALSSPAGQMWKQQKHEETRKCKLRIVYMKGTKSVLSEERKTSDENIGGKSRLSQENQASEESKSGDDNEPPSTKGSREPSNEEVPNDPKCSNEKLPSKEPSKEQLPSTQMNEAEEARKDTNAPGRRKPSNSEENEKCSQENDNEKSRKAVKKVNKPMMVDATNKIKKPVKLKPVKESFGRIRSVREKVPPKKKLSRKKTSNENRPKVSANR